MVDKEEPQNPEFSLYKQGPDGNRFSEGEEGFLNVGERSEDELKRMWRARLKKGRDFYRFYLAVYMVLFAFWHMHG